MMIIKKTEINKNINYNKAYCHHPTLYVMKDIKYKIFS